MTLRPTERALLAAALLAAGCVSVKSSPDEAPSLRKDGDTLMRAGDYEGASKAYERELGGDGDTAVMQEKHRTATRLAAQAHASRAVRAIEAGDPDLAARHLKRAEALGKDVPAVQRARKLMGERLEKTREARRLRDEGAGLVEIDPQRAMDLLVKSRELNPDDLTTVEALRDATLHAEAERAARRAAQSWDRGYRETAVDDLEDASVGGRPVAAARQLRRRMAVELLSETGKADEVQARRALEIAVRGGLDRNAVGDLRDAYVGKLTARSAKLRDEGYVALAALLELEARRAGADVPTPALDEVGERASVRVLVHRFEDATGGDVDGLRLARDLRARLEEDARGGGLLIGVLGPDGDPVRLAAAYPRALHLHGTALSRWVRTARVGRRTETVQYQTGVRREPNPDLAFLLEDLSAIRQDLDLAQDELTAADDEYRRLKGLPFRDPDRGVRARIGDVHYQTMLAKAEARLERARVVVKGLRQEELNTTEEIRRTPPEIEVPVYADHERKVTTLSTSSEMKVKLRLTDGDTVLMDQEVTGSDRHRETVAPAYEEGGIPADPDETPDEAAMDARAVARFTALASGRIRAAAEAGAAHFLRDARAAEDAGEKRAAAEACAMYLLATPDVATAKRSDAARVIEEVTGIRVPLRTERKRAVR